MAEKRTSFLGRGWSFPPTFNINNKSVEMVENEEDIAQSMQILLATETGERVMNPDYGSELSKLLFEPIDTTFETYIKDRVKDSILLHEPRVNVLEIGLERLENEGLINISVSYEVRGTNTRYNLVYPFYLNEATDI